MMPEQEKAYENLPKHITVRPGSDYVLANILRRLLRNDGWTKVYADKDGNAWLVIDGDTNLTAIEKEQVKKVMDGE